MKDLGAAHFCLGMRIQVHSDHITLDQSRYTEEVLEQFGLAKSRSVATPLPPRTELRPSDGSGGDPLLNADDQHLFRQIVGSLMFMVVCTRPDLAMAVNQLSRFMAQPSQAHMAAARHVLRYLRGTSDFQLYYSAASLATPQQTPADTLVKVMNFKIIICTDTKY